MIKEDDTSANRKTKRVIAIIGTCVLLTVIVTGAILIGIWLIGTTDSNNIIDKFTFQISSLPPLPTSNKTILRPWFLSSETSSLTITNNNMGRSFVECPHQAIDFSVKSIASIKNKTRVAIDDDAIDVNENLVSFCGFEENKGKEKIDPYFTKLHMHLSDNLHDKILKAWSMSKQSNSNENTVTSGSLLVPIVENSTLTKYSGKSEKQISYDLNSNCFSRTVKETFWDQEFKSYVKVNLIEYGMPCRLTCTSQLGGYSEWYIGSESEGDWTPVHHGTTYVVTEIPIGYSPVVRCYTYHVGNDDDDTLVFTRTFQFAVDDTVIISTGTELDNEFSYPQGVKYPEIDMILMCEKSLSASRTQSVVTKWNIPPCEKDVSTLGGFTWVINGKCEETSDSSSLLDLRMPGVYICRNENAWASIQVHHILPNEHTAPRITENGDNLHIHPHYFFPPTGSGGNGSVAAPSIVKVFRNAKTEKLYVSQQAIWNSVFYNNTPSIMYSEGFYTLEGEGLNDEFKINGVTKLIIGAVVYDPSATPGILTHFPLKASDSKYELNVRFVSETCTMKKRIPLELDTETGFIKLSNLPLDKEGFYLIDVYENNKRIAPPTFVYRISDHRHLITLNLEQARDGIQEEMQFDKKVINQKGLAYDNTTHNLYAEQINYSVPSKSFQKSLKKVVKFIDQSGNVNKAFTSFPESIPQDIKQPSNVHILSRSICFNFTAYANGISNWKFFNEHNSSAKILDYQSSYSFTSDSVKLNNEAVLVSESDDRYYRFLTNNTNSAINVIHPNSKIENDLKNSPYCFGPVEIVQTILMEYDPNFIDINDVKANDNYRIVWDLREQVSCNTTETSLCYVCRDPASISFEFWTILNEKKMEDSVYVDTMITKSEECDQLTVSQNMVKKAHNIQFFFAFDSKSYDSKSYEETGPNIQESVLRSFKFNGNLKTILFLRDSWFVVNKPLLLPSFKIIYCFKIIDPGFTDDSVYSESGNVFWVKLNGSLKLKWFRVASRNYDDLVFENKRGRRCLNTLFTVNVVVNKPLKTEMEKIPCNTVDDSDEVERGDNIVIEETEDALFKDSGIIGQDIIHSMLEFKNYKKLWNLIVKAVRCSKDVAINFAPRKQVFWIDVDVVTVPVLVNFDWRVGPGGGGRRKISEMTTNTTILDTAMNYALENQKIKYMVNDDYNYTTSTTTDDDDDDDDDDEQHSAHTCVECTTNWSENGTETDYCSGTLIHEATRYLKLKTLVHIILVSEGCGITFDSWIESVSDDSNGTFVQEKLKKQCDYSSSLDDFDELVDTLLTLAKIAKIHGGLFVLLFNNSDPIDSKLIKVAKDLNHLDPTSRYRSSALDQRNIMAKLIAELKAAAAAAAATVTNVTSPSPPTPSENTDPHSIELTMSKFGVWYQLMELASEFSLTNDDDRLESTKPNFFGNSSVSLTKNIAKFNTELWLQKRDELEKAHFAKGGIWGEVNNYPLALFYASRVEIYSEVLTEFELDVDHHHHHHYDITYKDVGIIFNSILVEIMHQIKNLVKNDSSRGSTSTTIDQTTYIINQYLDLEILSAQFITKHEKRQCEINMAHHFSTYFQGLNTPSVLLSILINRTGERSELLEFDQAVMLVSFGRLICGSLLSTCSDFEIVHGLEILLNYYDEKKHQAAWELINDIVVISNNLIAVCESMHGGCIDIIVFGGSSPSHELIKLASSDDMEWTAIILESMVDYITATTDTLPPVNVRGWAESLKLRNETYGLTLDKTLQYVRILKIEAVGGKEKLIKLSNMTTMATPNINILNSMGNLDCTLNTLQRSIVLNHHRGGASTNEAQKLFRKVEIHRKENMIAGSEEQYVISPWQLMINVWETLSTTPIEVEERPERSIAEYAFSISGDATIDIFSTNSTRFKKLLAECRVRGDRDSSEYNFLMKDGIPNRSVCRTFSPVFGVYIFVDYFKTRQHASDQLAIFNMLYQDVIGRDDKRQTAVNFFNSFIYHFGSGKCRITSRGNLTPGCRLEIDFVKNSVTEVASLAEGEEDEFESAINGLQGIEEKHLGHFVDYWNNKTIVNHAKTIPSAQLTQSIAKETIKWGKGGYFRESYTVPIPKSPDYVNKDERKLVYRNETNYDTFTWSNQDSHSTQLDVAEFQQLYNLEKIKQAATVIYNMKLNLTNYTETDQKLRLLKETDLSAYSALWVIYNGPIKSEIEKSYSDTGKNSIEEMKSKFSKVTLRSQAHLRYYIEERWPNTYGGNNDIGVSPLNTKDADDDDRTLQQFEKYHLKMKSYYHSKAKSVTSPYTHKTVYASSSSYSRLGEKEALNHINPKGNEYSSMPHLEALLYVAKYVSFDINNGDKSDIKSHRQWLIARQNLKFLAEKFYNSLYEDRVKQANVFRFISKLLSSKEKLGSICPKWLQNSLREEEPLMSDEIVTASIPDNFMEYREIFHKKRTITKSMPTTMLSELVTNSTLSESKSFEHVSVDRVNAMLDRNEI